MVTSVVIHQFDVPGLAVHPGEANAPLIIHANAVLPGAITPQLLETIARRYAQIIHASAASISSNFRIIARWSSARNRRTRSRAPLLACLSFRLP